MFSSPMYALKSKMLLKSGRTVARNFVLQALVTNDGTLRADVCIIGGGHAGCEAAAASARTGIAFTFSIEHNLIKNYSLNVL